MRAAEKGKWSGKAQAIVVSNLVMEEVRKGLGLGGQSLARSYVTSRKLYFVNISLTLSFFMKILESR